MELGFATLNVGLPRDMAPIKDIQQKCNDAGITIFLYFPAYKISTWETGGTPWLVKQEPVVFETALNRIAVKELRSFWRKDEYRYQAFEVEFDKDGDLVM